MGRLRTKSVLFAFIVWSILLGIVLYKSYAIFDDFALKLKKFDEVYKKDQ